MWKAGCPTCTLWDFGLSISLLWRRPLWLGQNGPVISNKSTSCRNCTALLLYKSGVNLQATAQILPNYFIDGGSSVVLTQKWFNRKLLLTLVICPFFFQRKHVFICRSLSSSFEKKNKQRRTKKNVSHQSPWAPSQGCSKHRGGRKSQILIVVCG